MNQNNDVDNELQRAIDDITKNNNESRGHTDPVAAPSMIEPGTENQMAPAVGLFSKRPTVQLGSTGTVADLGEAPKPDASGIMPPGVNELNTENFANGMVEKNGEDMAGQQGGAAPVAQGSERSGAGDSDMKAVKEAALRDLSPLVKNLEISAEEKFGIYKDIIETLGDQGAIADAYETAKGLSDEKSRGEALLYIVEKIDQLEK